MLSFILFFSPAFVLYVIPCLLPRHLFQVYAVVAVIGLSLEWRSTLKMMHSGEGGVSEVFGYMTLMGVTWATAAGIAARTLIQSLRGCQIRWRYAWLPAPIILALLVATLFAI